MRRISASTRCIERRAIPIGDLRAGAAPLGRWPGGEFCPEPDGPKPSEDGRVGRAGRAGAVPTEGDAMRVSRSTEAVA